MKCAELKEKKNIYNENTVKTENYKNEVRYKLMIKNSIEIGAKIGELKTCPFCGYNAYLYSANLTNGNTRFYVHCPNCGLKTKPIECDNTNDNPCDTIAKCIEMWNLRCEDDNSCNEPDDKSNSERITVTVRRGHNE